jgi:hypothetical protein
MTDYPLHLVENGLASLLASVILPSRIREDADVSGTSGIYKLLHLVWSRNAQYDHSLCQLWRTTAPYPAKAGQSSGASL